MRTLCCVLLLATSTLADDGGMQTRVFRLKNELIGGHVFVRPTTSEPPLLGDSQNTRAPFVAVNPDETSGPTATRQSAKAVLLDEGIPLPPGASAAFHPQSGLLSVRNTPENLRHTQLFLESFERDLPENQSYLITVIQAPGETIRQVNATAVSDPDCGRSLAALLAAARLPHAEVSVIGDAFLESSGEHRSTLSSVQQHAIPAGLTAKAPRSADVDIEWAGAGLTFEAAFWPHVKSHHLTLELSTRPPSQRSIVLADPATGRSGTFPATSTWWSSLTTTAHCEPGETRLLSVAAPLGAKGRDLLWAVFMTVGRQRIASMLPPSASLIESDRADAAASGLKQIAFHLPKGFLDFFIPDHEPDALQRWLESNGLEKVEGAAARQAQGRLEVTNTQENIERVHGLLREMRRSLPSTPVVALNTIRGPASRLRDLARAHILRGDHAALWEALQDEVAKGSASLVDTARIMVNSSSYATHHSGRKSGHLAVFSANANGQASIDFDNRPHGSVIELRAWLPANEEHVSVTLNHELETGPPSSSRRHFKHPVSGEQFELSLPVLHTAKTDHHFSITPGTTRLVSLYRPTDDARSDQLCATFISCDVVREIPSRPPAPAISTTRPGTPAKPSQDQNQKQETRVFQPPAKFFSAVASGWGPITADEARQALKLAGIELPPDALLQISGRSEILRVTAPRQILDQIDGMFKKMADHLGQHLVLTAHIFEGSGPSIRGMVESQGQGADDSALLTQLQTGAKIGRVKYVTTMRVETRSGMKAQADQARQIQQLKGLRPSEDGGTEFLMETYKNGHLFELEPTIHPEDNAITLKFALECSPEDPVERLEHLTDTAGRKVSFPLLDCLCARLDSSITMNPGATRLVWIHRVPETSDDRLCAVFLNYSMAAESQ